jgi:hypothetical protein
VGSIAIQQERVGGENPNLCLAIRNLLLKEIPEDVEVGMEVLRRLVERLRGELSLYALEREECFSSVAGADAGGQILPLASRRYAVVDALVYETPSGLRFFLPPLSLSFPYTISDERFRGIISVRREALLYETLVEYLSRDPEVELILVDGPLAFSNWWNMRGRRIDRRRLIDAVNRFLSICRERNIAVACVVKRPSARYLIYHLGLKEETELPDAFLLLHLLRPGERTGLFSPREALRRVVRSAPFMDALKASVYSFYCRLTADWSIPPVRVDVPDFSLGLVDEIADYCYWSSLWSGIPLPILRADEEVRISKRMIADIYSEIISRVGRVLGEVTYLAPYWGEGRWMGTS